MASLTVTPAASPHGAHNGAALKMAASSSPNLAVVRFWNIKKGYINQ